MSISSSSERDRATGESALYKWTTHRAVHLMGGVEATAIPCIIILDTIIIILIIILITIISIVIVIVIVIVSTVINHYILPPRVRHPGYTGVGGVRWLSLSPSPPRCSFSSSRLASDAPARPGWAGFAGFHHFYNQTTVICYRLHRYRHCYRNRLTTILIVFTVFVSLSLSLSSS